MWSSVKPISFRSRPDNGNLTILPPSFMIARRSQAMCPSRRAASDFLWPSLEVSAASRDSYREPGLLCQNGLPSSRPRQFDPNTLAATQGPRPHCPLRTAVYFTEIHIPLCLAERLAGAISSLAARERSADKATCGAPISAVKTPLLSRTNRRKTHKYCAARTASHDANAISRLISPRRRRGRRCGGRLILGGFSSQL